jgi:TPP-dependent pyruvate/acetoin dehydrogenase alpha subunit
MQASNTQRIAMYEAIVTSRIFDDRIMEIYFADKQPVFLPINSAASLRKSSPRQIA